MAGTLSVQKIQGLASSATPTTVEIASGHKLTGDAGSITAAGMVVQTAINSATSTVTASSGTPVLLTNVSITPKFSNSVMHVEGYVSRMNIAYGSSNAYASLYMQDGSDNTLAEGVLGSAIANSSSMALHGTHSPGSTSTQTYQLKIATASGGTSSVNTDGQRYTIKVMEIAQ